MKQKKWYSLVFAAVMIAALIVPQVVSAVTEEEVVAMMGSMNNQLALMGENVRVVVTDFLTYEEAGQRIYFNDRVKQMDSHWVPGDPRRFGVNEIYWISEAVEGTANGVTFEQTQTAVDNAMATWNTVNCATIPLVQLPDYGIDWGYVQWLLGMGGVPGWYADITHAGWLPGAFFDILGGPGGSDSILGVTFTFIWVDTDTGEPSDIDNNGKTDVAFREIYYNNKFPWSIGLTYPIDVESIVVHEMGHGVSLDHFGKLFRTLENGKLHWAPKAIMNAGYTGVQQELTGTDHGGFCSVWGSWPNN